MQDYCFLDLETTGFSPEKDSIIEVSFVRFQDGKLVSEVDQVCIPDKSELSDFVSNLTGITQKEINEEGVAFTTIAAEVAEKIGDSVIIGHNIDFDINFLVGNGIDVGNNPRIDTHELVRILLVQEESYALEVLCQKYGFIHESAHRAMSDVIASKKLFEFLTEKIEALPTQFLDEIRPVLESKTNWHAKELFLNSKGSLSVEKTQEQSLSEVPESLEKVSLPSSGEINLLKIGDAQKSADCLSNIPQQHPDKKFVIVTPKLNFYPYFKQFPTPEVLFDVERFHALVETREVFDDMETTFYLKCAYRNFLGHRGKQFFDIFTFKETPLWDQVCVKDENAIVFQEICKERESYQTITLTPYAFFRFSELPIFEDRVLIFDEGEMCAESLFFAKTKTFSLRPYLDNPDEETANEAQFIVTDFCKNVIEEELKQTISRFPTNLLLPKNRNYSRIAERVLELSEDLEELANILQNDKGDILRWASYYPESGNLVFHAWNNLDWVEHKKFLQKSAQIWTHRHASPERFFSIFSGESFTEKQEASSLLPSYNLTIPEGLTSATSPDFNRSCAQQIGDVFEQKCPNDGDHLAVYVSSVEALRQIHEIVGERFKNENVFVIGERASGGKGKILELLKNNASKRGVFFFQKLLDPVVASYNWKSIVVQKFPFNPPHPLFEDRELESQLGLSWWNDRVIPQVSANLSRAISQFGIEDIVFIDPRENAGWGKEILRKSFDERA